MVEGNSKALEMTAAMWSMWIWKKYGRDADIGASDVEVMLNLWKVVRAARIDRGGCTNAHGISLIDEAIASAEQGR